MLEVLLAVCLLGLVGMSIYRFVETTFSAVSRSTAAEQERMLATTFAGYLRTQIAALPSAEGGVISEESHRFQNISSDELRWIAGPGSGLLTRHAEGDWIVTLTAQPLEKREYELGMRRRELRGKRESDWLPLFRGVRGFEVRYFDAQRREWLEKWTETQRRPALIRVKLWRNPEPAPYEIVLPVPSARVQRNGGAA